MEPTEEGQQAQQPVVLNRTSSDGSSLNPFGSTFCYAYQDIIFEVTVPLLLISARRWLCTVHCACAGLL